MHKEPEWVLLQRRFTNGQQAYKKMLVVTNDYHTGERPQEYTKCGKYFMSKSV